MDYAKSGKDWVADKVSGIIPGTSDDSDKGQSQRDYKQDDTMMSDLDKLSRNRDQWRLNESQTNRDKSGNYNQHKGKAPSEYI